MNIFIMAAGLATRFNGVCKQLLPIGDNQTILSRQVSQVILHDPCIVSHNQEIVDYAYSNGLMTIIPASHDTLCNSILSTQYRWKDRVVILLGDVIYSHRVMHAILTEEFPINFFGDEHEMFALAFSTSEIHRIVPALQEGSRHPFGKLRYAYRAFSSTPWNQNESVKQLRDDPYFHYVDCWITRDCDSMDAYNNIRHELIDKHILETQ